jgi:hypothetical protein
MKELCQDFHYFTINDDATKSAKICPMVIGCPFTSWWIVEKRSCFSYLFRAKSEKLPTVTFLPILCNFSKVCFIFFLFIFLFYFFLLKFLLTLVDAASETL